MGFLCLLPSTVFAEVSDKLPSISIILFSSILIGAGLFWSGQFHWLFGVLLLPIPILVLSESFSLWDEMDMRNAILAEQGWVYFGVLGMQFILLIAGSIVGIVYGFIKSKQKL